MNNKKTHYREPDQAPACRRKVLFKHAKIISSKVNTACMNQIELSTPRAEWYYCVIWFETTTHLHKYFPPAADWTHPQKKKKNKKSNYYYVARQKKKRHGAKKYICLYIYI